MAIDELFIAVGNALDKNDLARAKEIVNQLENELSALPDGFKKVSYYANLGGILIDLGDWQRNEKVVEIGTEYAFNAISQLPKEQLLPNHYYNAANGYSALWKFRSKKCYQDGLIDESHLSAKSLYRQAIDLAKERFIPDRSLYCQLLVSYGNCLDMIGRRFEAVSYYEQALCIDPNMGEALGNKGITLLGLAPFMHGHRHSFYLEAHRLFEKAIEAPLHERTKQDFVQYHTRVEEVIHNHREIKPEKIERSKPRSRFQEHLRNFCEKHELYLTPTTAIGEKNQHLFEDPFFISTMTAPLNDTEKFDKYITFLNQIKQDYILARYLLVQSQFKSSTIDSIDQGVTLYYPLDYSVHSAYIQMQRTAFRLAVDVLDKIAYFVRDYFKVMSLSSKDVHFRNVFSTFKAPLLLRPELKSVKNPYLFGLLDLALDFREGGDFEYIYLQRNLLTHRFLVIQEYGSNTSNDIPRIELSKFTNQCVFAMKLARAALIYLILMVDFQEKQEQKSSTEYMPIMSSIPIDKSLRWKPRG